MTDKIKQAFDALERFKQKTTFEDYQTIRQTLTALEKLDGVDLEGLDESLMDHDCASDAILGKNIDVLAKAARTLADIKRGL